ncbi:hypothetical protein FDC22_01360 [Clostridium botulinum]|uniref:Uncharacterized protein n=1 Tax=Clostridium botulinum (strain Okra / Type B1) TaxID=498213 RepID=B1IGQ9_CLOBK|nr:hypothetical protein [Clostridium botulinum]EKX80479.1 hypothetical protein CFSAN001628_006709 [Clostridium botulinum CFSAN001628]ACA46268.1 hypothetical protein CLD_2418 [Clostridium botulinum B1 str. Okra]MBD5564020.1 hypothetical protein [Clostridium botulinum]MBD5566609.1 hypothetical protein [Clostridium botulinum]MBD5568875.1 hypothetical protein [Clostridium botulinum]
MDPKLVDYINKLEKENLELKKQLEETQKDIISWNNLKTLINNSLSELDETRGPYSYLIRHVESGINMIIRATFNLKFIKDIDETNYKQSKEFTEMVLDYVKKNFIKGKY